MKINKIYKQVMGAMILALTLVGCSDDWDAHYKNGGSHEGSLWSAIAADPELSNFASVVKECGLEKSLASNQVFTVFAPTNSQFSQEQAQAYIDQFKKEQAEHVKLNDNSTMKEFLQNHIALYNHSVFGGSNDSIVMMNGKYQVLTNNTFGGRELVAANQAYNNGVLFKLNAPVTYSPNVFEYLRKDHDLDSVANFLYAYNRYQFDPEASVAGDIVDGKTVYLDSVSYMYNAVLNTIGKLNAEDSSYWFVAPTNEEWSRLVPEYEKYFHYDTKVNKRDSLQHANARLMMIYGSVFSRSKNTEESIKDSAVSTSAVPYRYRQSYYGSFDDKYYQYDKPFEKGGVFDGTVSKTCSNGQVLKAAKWNFDIRNTFNQKILVETEYSNYLDSVETASTRVPVAKAVATNNPFYKQVSNHAFTQIDPSSSATTNTMSVFDIPSTLSNMGYDIYVATVPALAGDTLASAYDRLPTKFDAYLSYNNEYGNQIDEVDWTELVWHQETQPDAYEVFKIGDNISFPVATATQPQVKLILKSAVTNREIRNNKFNRILRIDYILLKPHEE